MWPHGYEVIIGRGVWRNSEGGSQFANGPGLRVRVNLVKSEEKVGDEAYSADPGGASYFLHSCKSCAHI